MGAAPSAEIVNHSKKAGEYEVQINRELIGATRGPMLLGTRARPIPGTDSYDLTSSGPPRGNDLFDLFLNEVPGAEAPPPPPPPTEAPPRQQQVERRDARWRLVVRSTSVLRQVMARLRELHALGFAHGDVKPENAVLMADEAGRPVVRLIDFGLACRLDPAGRDAWADAHRWGSYNAACILPSRFRGQPIAMQDMYGNPVVEVQLHPPTAEDDLYRALCNFHRLVTALDPGAAGSVAWPDSALYGAGGSVDRLPVDPAGLPVQGQHAGRLGDLVYRAAAGQPTEPALAAQLQRRRLGPGVRQHLETAHRLGQMMLECFNVASACAPTPEYKAQAWQRFTQLFDPATLRSSDPQKQNRQPARQQARAQQQQARAQQQGRPRQRTRQPPGQSSPTKRPRRALQPVN